MADRYRVGDNVANAQEITSLVTSSTEQPHDNVYVDLPSDPRSRPVLTATEFSNNSHKKKSTSFQITSVTVQGSRLGNDTGDDSADDLDESHTEDISSDILDCSKTTDLDNELVSSDNSNANVEEFGIPTLVLPTIQPIPVKAKSNEASVNFTVPLTIGVSQEHFTDVTIEQNTVNSGVTLVTTTTSPPSVTAQVPMVNSMPDHWQHRFKVVKIVSSEPFRRGRWLCMDFTDPPPIHSEPKPETTETSLQPNETMPIQNSLNILATCDPVEKQNVGAVTHVYEFPVNQSLPGSIAVKLNPSQPASQPVYSILVPVSSAAANSVQTPTVVTTTAATGVQTGTSIIPPTVTSIAQNVAVQTAPVTVITSSVPQATTTNLSTAVLPNPTSIPPTNIIQQPMMVSNTITNMNVVSQINQPPTLPQMPPLSNATLPISSQEVNQIGPQAILPTATIVSTSNIPIQVTSLPTTEMAAPNTTAVDSSQPTLSVQKNTLDISNSPANVSVAPTVSSNQSPLLEMLPDALGTKALQEGEDSESAPAGTSTVAIDNKIEQAMDLVKSHLMFAVREEVDVLKEKITELMDRISQLELENGILKANATQETLSQLPQGQTGQVVTQNTQNNQTGQQQQTVPPGGQLIRPPNANQTQNNQTTS